MTFVRLVAPASRAALLVVVSALSSQFTTALAQGSAFTYQGRLNSSGVAANGAYDFRFRLASDPFANFYVGSTLLTNGVSVTDGLFTVPLDFGAGIFNGSNYWLEVSVRTNGAGAYITLAPPQPLTPAPYAIFAEGASNVLGIIPSGGLSGPYPAAVTFSNSANSFAGAFNGNGTGLTNVNASTLGGLSAGQFWTTAGNSNTVGGVNFIGTADNQPMEIRVNNTRAILIMPTTNTVNFIGGDPHNYASNGVYGATIGGGGTLAYPGGTGLTNQVLGSFDTIGGGAGNTANGNFNNSGDSATVAGGFQNSALGNNAAIGGGLQNVVQSDNSVIAGGADNNIPKFGAYATIAGGLSNTNGGNETSIGGGLDNFISYDTFYSTISGGVSNSISGLGDGYQTIGGGGLNTIASNARSSTIGGGVDNLIAGGAYRSTISGGNGQMIFSNSFESVISGGHSNVVQMNSDHGVISGGYSNTVTGPFGIIAGGSQNVAGTNSFAAGNRAKATDMGSFVWADSQDADFGSTTSNQFSIRASGGIRFETGGAGIAVDGAPPGSLGNFVFASNSGLQAVATANIFQDLNFLGDAQIDGWTHSSGTAQYTNAQSGLYLVQYYAQVQTTGIGTNAQVRATLNTSEIGGSRSFIAITALNQLFTASKSFIVSANASDVLALQFTGTGTGVRLSGTANSTLTITRIR
jgi:hypothetical protein